MLPTWTPFPDTNESLIRLKRKYKLGILSNVDRDLFAETAKHFPIEFDFVVTAQDVQCYKPAHGLFKKMLADHANSETTLHVAQSLFHDGIPARDISLAFVWINRYNQQADAALPMAAEMPNLKALADAACGEA